MGVRRTGKTVLCQGLPEVEYLDCELPSVRRRVADPEAFLAAIGRRRVVLDEIHRLDRPAEILKIAAIGILWEHLVLDELHAHTQRRSVMYWRTKRGEKIDFLLPVKGAAPTAIECKRKAGDFDPKALLMFRQLHPGGRNYVVATDVPRPYDHCFGDVPVRFVGLPTLIEEILPASPTTKAPPKRAGRRTPKRG